ncbi:hypothetical protein KW797_00350 [Candidatus Parcubacteria bacterium]|nr:hypothetical protein [Candidatus Parcubacteria bacterium]
MDTIEPFYRAQRKYLSTRVTEDGVIELELGGDAADHLDDFHAWAEDVKNAMRKVSAARGGKVITLIDITNLHEFDSSGMEIIKGLMDFNKQYATRTATFGGDFFATMAQNVLEAAAGRHNMKAFKTRDEALEWLRDESQA